MKAKYIIITLLVLLLSGIIYQMMKFENSIRETRIVKIKVTDETRPLIDELPADQLYKLSLKADYYFMARGDYFQRLNTKIENDESTKEWEQIFLKGVNIGAAMPGYFPTEFSLTFNQYLEWFRLIGEMNANVIRTYTILPPEFYEAFSYYNFHYYNKKLYILQGVWAEEPETDNYFHPQFDRRFRKEIMHVIDVIHGNAVIEPKAGHASGTYASDISKYVIGIILGREWEPKAVIHTNKVNELNQFNGNFISINNGNPMEVWLAKMMDFTVLYETQMYTAQHPISFVNWLPLDPMYHPTEFIENKKVREYDNDIEQLDFRKYHSTQLFIPGVFASYHAYPYYPDFIYLQENYAASLNKNLKKDNYYGYLSDLKQYAPAMPLVIAEYGLPSSRGNSHYTYLGLDQGGHSEKEQALLSWQLTKDIHDTRCAGAIFFEWIDEWFKFNWLVMDFEQPYDRRKLWHNMENPEQNFGIMAIESEGKKMDGDLSDWENKTKTAIEFDADASYFYVAAHLPEFNLKNQKLYLAIDTYDKDKGDHVLPFLKHQMEHGIEFLVTIDSTENSKILVDEPYSVYTDIYHDLIPVYASRNNSNGKFIDQLMLSNRGREILTGDTIAPIIHNRSDLLFGKNKDPHYSNADWYWDENTKTLELRLSWQLLNVSDPSGRNVLNDQEGTPDIEYMQTDGFNIFPFITDKNNQLLPNVINGKKHFFSWDTWEKPVYKSRLKPLYTVFKDSFPVLVPLPFEYTSAAENFVITPFHNNKPGAISIMFNDANYSQYEVALPILDKYRIKSTFGIVNDWVSNSSSAIRQNNGIQVQKMGWNQINELAKQGHEISCQLSTQNTTSGFSFEKASLYLKKEKEILEKKIAYPISTIYYPQTANNWIGKIKNAGFKFGYTGTEGLFQKDYNNLFTITAINTSLYNLKALDSIIKSGYGKWQQFQYANFSATHPASDSEQSLENGSSINASLFERQIRLLRNSDYWIAPLEVIGKYLEERKASKIKYINHNNMIFLTVQNELPSDFNQPLTIQYNSSHQIIRVSNSPADGIYNARNGIIYFQAFPNREVRIEILY